MIIRTPHECTRADFGRVLNCAAPTTIQLGSIITNCSIIDPRLKTIDLGDNLRYVLCVVRWLELTQISIRTSARYLMRDHLTGLQW